MNTIKLLKERDIETICGGASAIEDAVLAAIIVEGRDLGISNIIGLIAQNNPPNSNNINGNFGDVMKIVNQIS